MHHLVSICLSIYLSIYISIFLSFYLSFYLSTLYQQSAVSICFESSLCDPIFWEQNFPFSVFSRQSQDCIKPGEERKTIRTQCVCVCVCVSERERERERESNRLCTVTQPHVYIHSYSNKFMTSSI